MKNRTRVQNPVTDLTVHNMTLYGAGAGVVKITPSGDFLSPGFPGIGTFVFDASGNVYVANRDKPFDPAGIIKKFDAAGNLTRTWSLPVTPSAIDLASDQCTLYFIASRDGSEFLGRYDLCNAVGPADVAVFPTEAGNLRILGGGDVLVGLRESVVRIRPDGQIRMTYLGASQVALDAYRTAFWTNPNFDRLLKIDLQSGAILAETTPEPAGLVVDSLTVVGEPRAGTVAAIPALSGFMIGLLCCALVTIALTRL